LGGAKIAYLAYQKSLEGKARPADIDGFTPEQQFFIAWGQFRGDEIRIETQRLMMQTDPSHLPKRQAQVSTCQFGIRRLN
jgi:endothelin-converting enzyme/putative endopeptidase